MKILRKTLGLAALAVISAKNANASDVNQERVLETLKPGVYYHLTPIAAQALGIDMTVLAEAAQLKRSQQLAFQLQEDGELNLSV